MAPTRRGQLCARTSPSLLFPPTWPSVRETDIQNRSSHQHHTIRTSSSNGTTPTATGAHSRNSTQNWPLHLCTSRNPRQTLPLGRCSRSRRCPAPFYRLKKRNTRRSIYKYRHYLRMRQCGVWHSRRVGVLWLVVGIWAGSGYGPGREYIFSLGIAQPPSTLHSRSIPRMGLIGNGWATEAGLTSPVVPTRIRRGPRFFTQPHTRALSSRSPGVH